MRVEILYLDGCPNYEPLVCRVRGIVRREGIGIDLSLRRVGTEGQASRLGFLGSPTVLVDGRDVDAAAVQRRDFGLKCRLYRTRRGLEGAPPDEWIAAAIRGRARQA